MITFKTLKNIKKMTKDELIDLRKELWLDIFQPIKRKNAILRETTKILNPTSYIKEKMIIIKSNVEKYKVLVSEIKKEVDKRNTKKLYYFDNETDNGVVCFYESVSELIIKLKKYEKSLKINQNKLKKYNQQLEKMKGGE